MGLKAAGLTIHISSTSLVSYTLNDVVMTNVADNAIEGSVTILHFVLSSLMLREQFCAYQFYHCRIWYGSLSMLLSKLLSVVHQNSDPVIRPCPNLGRRVSPYMAWFDTQDSSALLSEPLSGAHWGKDVSYSPKEYTYHYCAF